jgi:putative N6-adenine-specific DNA methylase
MPEFFVSTSKGLEDALCSELKDLGIRSPDKTNAGAYIECNWEDVYRLNLQSRVASRILKPVLDFTAYQGEELYNQLYRNHDFTKYFKVNQTFMVEASTRESMMHDQRFIALKFKDVIADQFREKYGERPNVDKDAPAVRFYIKAYKNHFSVAVDTSGEGLYMRGYRMATGLAPIKENLAAALIKMTGWKMDVPIVDLTCGSGTILIEAAMMALNIAPGAFRKHFAFETFPTFKKDAWEKVVDESLSGEREELPFKFYGFDSDRQVIKKAKENARHAGVDHLIDFRSESIATIEPPCEKGIIVINPPYGTRIGEEDNLRDVYRDLGFTLKNRFKGWDCYILSGNKDLIRDLKLKASHKFFVYNGSIECRLLKYTIKD